MNDTFQGTFQGTSLRDKFAMFAMSRLLASDLFNLHTWEDIAEASYEVADAMLKERGKSTASRYGKKRQQ